MSFFCYERGPSGRAYPVIYDEHPMTGRIEAPRGLIKETIREMPAELEGWPLIAVAAYFSPIEGF